ncbi:MAG: hypothetical protein HQK65_00095 [Desulfamplus sp.]|nr:hypothetical protein [Desulfamplus sp.]
MKTTNLYLFENVDYAEQVIRDYEAEPGVIIAFSVQGYAYLRQKGIEVFFPDDFIELPDFNQMGMENWEVLTQICQAIDTKIQNEIQLVKKYNLNLAGASFFVLKIALDTIRSSYIVLDAIKEKIQAQKIHVYLAGDQLGNDNYVPCDPGLFAFSHVFADRMEKVTVHDGKKKTWKHIMSNLRKHFFLHVRKLYFFAIFNSGRNVIFNLKSSHDLAFVRRLLTKYRFVDITALWEMQVLVSQTNILQKVKEHNIVGSQQISKIFTDLKKERLPEDKDKKECFVDLFYEMIESYFSKNLPKLLNESSSLFSLFQSNRCKLLLTSDCRLGLKEACVLEVAKVHNVAITSYQEGGGCGYVDWPLFNLDTKFSDYFLTYGKGVSESPLLNKNQAKLVSVGSLRMERIKSNLNSTREYKKEVYVVLDSLKKTSMQHFPYNGGYFSQAYQHQVRILKLLKDFPDTNFVIKTVTGNELLYREFLAANVRLETCPLTEVLGKASGFVLEWPSTVFQECVLTDVPIALLYNPVALKIEPTAIESIKCRARVSEKSNEFSEIIKNLIQDTKTGNPMVHNQDFLKQYVLMDNTLDKIKNFIETVGGTSSYSELR